MTLSLGTAYRSFGGEVEASSTPTICRLPDSRRHQLWAIALALYAKHLSGVWRLIYVITAMVSLYLNVFVVIVQSFLKIEPLRALAPTQTEPAFLAAQGAALLLFVAITILATMRFRPMQFRAA